MVNGIFGFCSGICGEECYNFIYYGDTIFSGICLLTAICLASIQIARHLQNYTNPHFQNKILSIIFAAPFYGATSYLTIITDDDRGFWILLRSIYDSILIYFFFNLVVSYVIYDNGSMYFDILYEAIYKKGVIKHKFPVNYFLEPIKITSVERGRFFYLTCKNNLMQFFILNAVLTFLNCIITIAQGSKTWININNAILFVSIGFCIYYLVLFYIALKDELRPFRPLPKFLAVKGVIFFPFWQETFINIFQGRLIGLFKACDIAEFDPEYILNAASCMLVCFEVILLTILTGFAFNYKDFESSAQGPLRGRLLSVVTQNIQDQMLDVGESAIARSFPFRNFKPPVIMEKEMTVFYPDEQGNLIDASEETTSVLYQSSIQIMPDSLVNHRPKSAH